MPTRRVGLTSRLALAAVETLLLDHCGAAEQTWPAGMTGSHHSEQGGPNWRVTNPTDLLDYHRSKSRVGNAQFHSEGYNAINHD